uniref:NlpC/P60 domain-containing protein n=1 Tax=Mycobacterium tuberculosis variant bovis BCG TaxID=33892 RepID=O52585_MYCTB|nr:unknown [Mycobacterium tuberculosis variant bovis BCG]
MKRSMKSGSFAIGLAMMLAPMVAAPGLAAADPATRPVDYQQITDVVIARGLSQRGVPFSWAGGGISGPTRGTGTGINTVGFDASGLIQYAYAGAGLKLPRSSGQMYKVGQKVLPQQARKGDLIFYGPEGTQSVALYLGKGQMLEVGDVVQVSPVRTNGMTPYLVGFSGPSRRPSNRRRSSQRRSSKRPSSKRPSKGARPTGAGPTGAGPASARPASARPAASLRHRALTLTVPLAFSPPKPASCFPLLSARSRRLVWVN